MRRALIWLASIFALAYVVALAVLLVGAFGLFGQPSDPLSGIYVIVLGMPWVLLADKAGAAGPWTAALLPLVNLLILLTLARLVGARRLRK